MRQLATPGSPRPPRRLDVVAVAVAAGMIALAVALAVSVVSLITRYVGWAPVGIAVGAISLVCVLGFVALGLSDRRASRGSG
jgi:predicted MFS family arabinose efflux permease